MRKLLLLLALTFNVLFVTHSKAELFDGSVHFYIKAGQSLTANTEITILYFDKNNSKIRVANVKKYEVSQNLQKDKEFYNNRDKHNWNSYGGKYQPDLSTYSTDVYGQRSYTQRPYTGQWYPGCPMYENIPDNYFMYRGFAKDKSKFVWWREDLDGNILDKTHFIEVSIDDLLPKNINRDFLYD